MNAADTIFALSSGTGRAGVAVFRISGANAQNIFSALTHIQNPTPRHAYFAKLKTPENTVIDEALALYFTAPKSFTGEAMAEFHVHGGKAVITALHHTLLQLGCRMAEAGEFTRRAFQNDKMDLAEAEGIADLIDAETEAQRKQALRQMGGVLSQLTMNWREKLLHILAHIEADIDFPEEDLPADISAKRLAELESLEKEITAHLADNRRGERLREGFSIAVLGAPNAGKSSLINALAQRDAAIVSARAGTTRDVIEVHLDIGGYPVLLADTAGLRETADEIESEGIRRALARAEDADLKIILFDANTAADETSLKLVDEKSFVVVNKVDMAITSPLPSGGVGGGNSNQSPFSSLPFIPSRGEGKFLISAHTGQGIPELLTALSEKLKSWVEGNPAPPLTRERHRAALTGCQQHLMRAISAYKAGKAPELVGEDIRLATRDLARITGAVDVDDILDIIFREFCIGK